MYYEVYLDAVFVTNFIMDFVLLRLLMHIFRYESTWLRLILGAAIGAAGSCLILLIPTEHFFPAVILLHGVSAVFMVKVGCRVRTKSMLIQSVTALYFTAFLCGGFWEILYAGSKVTSKTFFLFAAVKNKLIFAEHLCVSVHKLHRCNAVFLNQSVPVRRLPFFSYFSSNVTHSVSSQRHAAAPAISTFSAWQTQF